MYEVKIMELDEKNEELNQLLKGTHMGASIFEKLRESVTSEKLKEEFHEILEKLRMHEYSLTAMVIANHGEPVDDAGVLGLVTNGVYNVKRAFLRNDKEVLEEAIKSMEAASKALQRFEDKHFEVDKNLRKTLHIMEDDYKSIYHMLHKYLIEFK